MTLDEAIKHAETVAEEKKVQAWEAQLQEEYGKVKSCKECAKEHRQLVEWLKELKQLREQESCEDVPDTNVGDIYKCSCGYGWDKSKVVKHHFCPNCGKAVNPSYNSVKIEQQSVLNEIRAEIEETYMSITFQENRNRKATWGLRKAMEIIDKYREE